MFIELRAVFFGLFVCGEGSLGAVFDGAFMEVFDDKADGVFEAHVVVSLG
jgi:hypothetical protein